jgi:hypothetical protein
VDKEVAWWLDNRSPARLLVALTEPYAPDQDPDRGPDRIPLPPVLRSDGAPQPLTVDLTGVSRARRIEVDDPQAQRSIAELAAHLHGRPADELVTADADQRRRRTTRTRYVAAALAALFVAAVVFAVTTSQQTRRADAATQVATAHLLAATALATADTDLERAALLAAEGYRLDPGTQTLTALLRSVDGSSSIGARALADDEVIVAAAVPVGRGVVIGTTSGEILRWDLRTAPVRLATVDARPRTLATSDDGTVVVVATQGSGAGVWLHAAGRTRKVQDVDAVGVDVDPSGTRYATVRWLTDGHLLEVRTVADGDLVADADLSRTAYDEVQLQDDGAVLHQRLTNWGIGAWQRRSLPGLEVLDEGTVLDDDLAEDVGRDVVTTQAITQDGRWAATQLDDAVHLVDTTTGARSSLPVPAALGTYPMSVLAISPHGGKVLLARRDEVWVVNTPDQDGESAAERLEGISAPDDATFLDEDVLLLTQDRTLTGWDLNSGGTLGRTTAYDDIPLDRALTADGATLVAAGRQPIAANPAGAPEPGTDAPLLATTHAFTPDDQVRQSWPAVGRFVVVPPVTHLRGKLDDAAGAHLLPVPLADGTLLFVDGGDGAVYASDAAIEPDPDRSARGEPGAGAPALVPRFTTRAGEVLDAGADAEGNLVLAGADGTVEVRDAQTGRLLHEARATGGESTESGTVSGTEVRAARISPAGDLVAFHRVRTADKTLRTARIDVLDVATSRTNGWDLSAGRFTARSNEWGWRWPVALAFGDDYLAVAHAGGLAVLDRDGGGVRREISAPTTGRQNTVAPVPGTALVALAGDADWVRLFDTTTGEEVGHLSPRASALDGESPLWLAAGKDALWAVGRRYITRWDVRPERLHAQACALAARDLTAAEWRQAVGASAEVPDDLTCDRPLEEP